ALEPEHLAEVSRGANKAFAPRLLSSARVDSAVLVDCVTLCFEQRRLRGRVRPVQAAVRRKDAPPRQAHGMTQHVRHGLPATRTSELLGQLAIGDELTGLEPSHGI